MSSSPPDSSLEAAWRATAGLALVVTGFGVAALAFEGIGPAALIALPCALLAGGTAVLYRARALERARQAEEDAQTELVELYETQAANARRLRQVEGIAELGLVAAQVGHELRNHLMSLDLNLEFTAEVLRNQRDAIDLDVSESDQVRGAVGDALSAADRIREITSDLRVLTRGTRPAPGGVQVDAALQLAIRMARPVVESRARLVVDLHRVQPVMGDLGRLSQAVLNLLLNSAQAIPRDSERTHFVGIRCFDEGERVVIVVEDNGSGIPLADQDRIFDTFYTTKGESGTGLGLSFVRREVQALGGQILVESREGEGATFLIQLPAHRPGKVSAARFRVLVIHADPLSARAAASHLHEAFDVVVARSAPEALDALGADAYDALVCQADLPGMSGVELYEHLEKHDPRHAERLLFVADDGHACPRDAISPSHAPSELVAAVRQTAQA